MKTNFSFGSFFGLTAPKSMFIDVMDFKLVLKQFRSLLSYNLLSNFEVELDIFNRVMETYSSKREVSPEAVFPDAKLHSNVYGKLNEDQKKQRGMFNDEGQFKNFSAFKKFCALVKSKGGSYPPGIRSWYSTLSKDVTYGSFPRILSVPFEVGELVSSSNLEELDREILNLLYIEWSKNSGDKTHFQAIREDVRVAKSKSDFSDTRVFDTYFLHVFEDKESPYYYWFNTRIKESLRGRGKEFQITHMHKIREFCEEVFGIQNNMLKDDVSIQESNIEVDELYKMMFKFNYALVIEKLELEGVSEVDIEDSVKRLTQLGLVGLESGTDRIFKETLDRTIYHSGAKKYTRKDYDKYIELFENTAYLYENIKSWLYIQSLRSELGIEGGGR